MQLFSYHTVIAVVGTLGSIWLKGLKAAIRCRLCQGPLSGQTCHRLRSGSGMPTEPLRCGTIRLIPSEQESS